MKPRPSSSQARPAAHPALSGAVVSTGSVVAAPLLTISEVAHALRCSTRSVHRLISTGRLPAIKVAGSRLVRIEQTALERLLEPVGPVLADLDLEAFIAGGAS
jgi:excisionase family DNA binding protein